MADVDSVQGYQAHDTRTIRNLAAGETVVVSYAAARSAGVAWDKGGVTWTINPVDEDNGDFSVAVAHTLVPAHAPNAEDYWVPDAESPFDEASDGAEEYRHERTRFVNAGPDAVHVVIASPSKISVEQV
ncbi:MAG: hypothetical protein OXC08_16450 [Thiotrichales bacterium]|nr:hypothetical protein [Thiotrichales bacterium]